METIVAMDLGFFPLSFPLQSEFNYLFWLQKKLQ
jgi:hypothetical protein